MDLRTQRTRKLLFEAFTRLLGEKGLEDITVSELCDAAMVRRATFYRHFRDKDDFFDAYVGQVRRDISDRIAERLEPDSTIQEFCLRMTEVMADLTEVNEGMLRRRAVGGGLDGVLALVQKRVAEDFGAMVRGRLHDGGDGESLGGEVPPRGEIVDWSDALASFYIGGLYALARRHLEGSAPFDRDLFLEQHRRLTEMLFSDEEAASIR